MNAQTFKRCPSCGGPTEFSPSTQGLACSYCRAQGPITARPKVREVPLARADDTRVVSSTELRTAKCSNCGASEMLPPNTSATRCAFCTHPLIIDATNAPRLPSDNLVPFRVDKIGAEGAFSRWLSGLWFRPSDLKKSARIEQLRGVYIPSWVFSTHVRSDWRAEAGYHYYKTETVVDSNGVRTERRVQHTRWEPASGTHDTAYLDLVVEASKGLTEAELDAIGPFEVQDAAVAYQDDYLAGFEAECLSSTAAHSFTHAKARIDAMEIVACRGLVPGDTQRNLQVMTRTADETAASALMPVYIAAYIYRDTVYRLLVNGQNAKVVGKAPWSVAKIVSTIVAVILFIVLIIKLS